MGSGRPDDRPLDEVGVTAEQGLGGQVAAQRAVLDTATEELEQRLADLRVGRAGRLWPEGGEGGVLAAGGEQAAGDPGDRLSNRDRVGPGLADAVLDLAGRAVGEGAQQRLAAGEVPVQLAVRHAVLPATPANLPRLNVLLEQFRAIAARHGATPAAIALAWTIGPGPVVVVPGASSIGQLDAHVAAPDIALREDEQQALTAAATEVRQGPV